MKQHYHYGAGLRGYLYQDGPYYSKTLEQAVRALGESYELNQSEIAKLRKNRILNLNLAKQGNEYCEITVCERNTCENENS